MFIFVLIFLGIFAMIALPLVAFMGSPPNRLQAGAGDNWITSNQVRSARSYAR